MKQVRLYEIESDGTKWYLCQDLDGMTSNKKDGGLFRASCRNESWVIDTGLLVEELPEDEALRLLGAPTLPGLELA